MTTSLALHRGDLLVKSRRAQLASGVDKLKQQIFLWLLEAYGVDRFHPQYGSTLSGYVGTVNTLDNAFEIEVEVHRVLGNLQRYQKTIYEAFPSRYTPDELLDTIIEVKAIPQLDRLDLTIVFATATGRQETQNVSFE